MLGTVRLVTALLTLAVLPNAPASAQTAQAGLELTPTDAWKPIVERDGVRSYRLDVEGSAHDAYRADANLCASQDELLALFNEPEGFQNWLPRTESVELVEQSAFSQTVYVVSDAPWPLRSRDLTYALSIELIDDGAWVSITGLPDERPPQRGKVRIASANGDWVLRFLEDQVHVSFMLHIEAGKVPAILARRTLHYAVRNTLVNLMKTHPCDDV